MIQARLALLLFVMACWDGWRLLAGRIDQGPEAAIILAVALIAGFGFAWRQLGPERRVGVVPVAGILLCYAAAALFGTALVQIGIAVCGVIIIIHFGMGGGRLPVGWIVAAMLLMPVLPTLDFFLAWPMRRLSAMLTAAMLRLNGFPVGVEGVAISWRGRLLLFDGPCSGIRMLWAALLLTSLLAILTQMPPRRTMVALLCTALAAIPTNAIRAASLFFVESGFLPQMQGPIMHEALGIAAFAMLAALLFWGFRGEAARVT